MCQVVCQKATGRCEDIRKCGANKPHDPDTCEPCPFDLTAKCIAINPEYKIKKERGEDKVLKAINEEQLFQQISNAVNSMVTSGTADDINGSREATKVKVVKLCESFMKGGGNQLVNYTCASCGCHSKVPIEKTYQEDDHNTILNIDIHCPICTKVKHVSEFVSLHDSAIA